MGATLVARKRLSTFSPLPIWPPLQLPSVPLQALRTPPHLPLPLTSPYPPVNSLSPCCHARAACDLARPPTLQLPRDIDLALIEYTATAAHRSHQVRRLWWHRALAAGEHLQQQLHIGHIR